MYFSVQELATGVKCFLRSNNALTDDEMELEENPGGEGEGE